MDQTILFPAWVETSRKKRGPSKHESKQDALFCALNPWCCTEKCRVKLYFKRLNLGDDFADIASLNTHQINYGRGPTSPSRCFRVYLDDPRIDVWTNTGTDTFELVNVSRGGYPKIDFDQNPLECPICNTEKEYLIYAKCCRQPVYCLECHKHYNRCTICRKTCVNDKMMVTAPQNVVLWLKK